MTTFSELPWDHEIQQIVSPLIAVNDGRQEYIEGTAFIISKGFAITAYHVIQDLLHKYQGVNDVDSYHDMNFHILLFVHLRNKKDVLPMRVMRIWNTAPLDIAILAFGVPADWPNDYNWVVPKLSLLPPKIGETIVAIGFPNSKILPTEDTKNHSAVTAKCTLSTGIVTDIHHNYRDTGLLKFPCFSTNARFDGGMSGGPVFNNSNGAICGVICNNLPPENENEEHASNVSTLWPISGILIDINTNLHPKGVQYPFYELFKSKEIITTDHEKVILKLEPNGARSVEAHYIHSEWDINKKI